MGDRDRHRDQDWNADWNRSDATSVTCLNCGAENPAGSTRCRTCGRPLPTASPETIIEVTSGEPRIVRPIDDDEPNERTTRCELPGGFGGLSTTTFDRGRVVVARGGSRGCLITLALFALVSCCVCWILWSSIGGIV